MAVATVNRSFLTTFAHLTLVRRPHVSAPIRAKSPGVPRTTRHGLEPDHVPRSTLKPLSPGYAFQWGIDRRRSNESAVEAGTQACSFAESGGDQLLRAVGHSYAQCVIIAGPPPPSGREKAQSHHPAAHDMHGPRLWPIFLPLLSLAVSKLVNRFREVFFR